MHITARTPARWRVGKRIIVVAACALATLVAIQSAGAQATLAQQRAAFRAAYTAAQNGRNWRPLAKGLKDYPLYPYLEAAALQHGIKTVSRARVDAYLHRYRGMIPAHDVRVAELHQLAQRKRWHAFQHFYQPGLGTTLTCDALRARLAEGKQLHFHGDFAALWKKSHLPSACNPVLGAAFAQGLLTPRRVWDRIERAADAGRGGAVAYSAQWLEGAARTWVKRIAEAVSAPSALLARGSKFSDTPRDREAVARALVRLAPRDSQKAIAFWRSLSKRFQFSRHQRNRVLAALALYNAVDDGPHAIQRLADLPAAAQTDATREWRVRAAVAAGNWQAAQAAVDALKPAEMQHDQWRYWKARIAQKLGHASTALADYTALADQATFYGFLAADRARLPYSICPETIAADPAVDRHLATVPGLERAFELFAVDLLPLARREWSRAFAGLTPDQQRQAAALAAHRGWYSRAVFALGKLDQDAYALRFPLADKQRVLKAAHGAGIAPAWAYAIIRAESAWAPDAHSGAGARGLMQLLPSTAARLARLYDLVYRGPASLYDPAVNIPLGTRYLARLARQFDGNPWLATAAYNAGPGNVRRWVAARGKLDPERFIFTIPFHATRAYVTRVLSFETVYDWRLHGAVVPVSSRLRAIGAGSDPAPAPERKRVVCRTPVASVAPAASGGSASLSPISQGRVSP